MRADRSPSPCAAGGGPIHKTGSEGPGGLRGRDLCRAVAAAAGKGELRPAAAVRHEAERVPRSPAVPLLRHRRPLSRPTRPRPMQHRRTLPLLVAAVLVVGIVLGFHVRDVASGTDDRLNRNKIEEAFNIITQGYVERVDSAQLAEAAIEGMLAALDPHSIYISADEMRDVQESFNASFEGIGIYYELIEGPDDRDTLAVLMPIAGGPSEEAGLHPGDRIIQIDDTTAIGFDTELVQRYLKGPAGTEVTVKVRRPGYRDTLSFTITRDRIPLETVIAAYMLDDETGYIKLQRFARTSHAEVLEALQALRAQGM